MDCEEPDPLGALFSEPADLLLEASGSEASAIAVLERARWPGGPECARCGPDAVHSVAGTQETLRRALKQCKECGQQFSWRKGTSFSGDRNRPTSIVLASGLLLRGDTPGDVVAELASIRGVGYRRAMNLVQALAGLQREAVALAEGPGENGAGDVAMEDAPVEPSIPPGPPAPAPEATVSPSVNRVAVALLAVGVALLVIWRPWSSEPDSTSVRFETIQQALDSSTIRTVWKSNGRMETLVTTREQDQPYNEFQDAHNASLAHQQRLHPVD